MVKPRPTLAHVAKAANVSVTTASAALRGSGRVNPQTRKLVQDTADRLGYRKNSGASTLRGGGSSMIGMILESDAFVVSGTSRRLFWPRFLNAFAGEVSAAGMGVALVSRENVDPVLKLPIDALVVMADLAEGLADRVPYGMPVISGSAATANAIAAATHDYRAIAAECCSHLVTNSATQIGIVVPESPVPTAEVIVEAFLAESAASGVPVRLVESVSAVVDAVASGVDALVVVGGDAAGVVADVTSRGRRIPEDVLLLSLNETDAEVGITPEISTLSFEGSRSGRLVAAMVVEGLTSGSFESVELPYELRRRESSNR